MIPLAETMSSSKVDVEKLNHGRDLLNETLIELYGNAISEKNGKPKVRRSEGDFNSLIFNGLSKDEIQIASDIAFSQSKVDPNVEINIPQVHGPYEQSQGTSVQVVRDNVQIFWGATDGTNYPLIGYYIADVMRYTGWYAAPANAIAGYLDEEHIPDFGWGYLHDSNFNESARGANYSQVRLTDGRLLLKGTTHSLIIIMNMIGQTINAHKPFSAYG